jgi:hypothetical protein
MHLAEMERQHYAILREWASILVARLGASANQSTANAHSAFFEREPVIDLGHILRHFRQTKSVGTAWSVTARGCADLTSAGS